MGNAAGKPPDGRQLVLMSQFFLLVAERPFDLLLQAHIADRRLQDYLVAEFRPGEQHSGKELGSGLGADASHSKKLVPCSVAMAIIR